MNENQKASPKLQKPCQYQYSGCQEITDLQLIKKLGTVTIGKSWICDNCLKELKKYETK